MGRRARSTLAGLAAALSALGPAPGAGAEPGAPLEIGALDLTELLDPSIAAASLHEERSSAAPAAVFVLTADEIRRQGHRTLAEALRAVPGLFTYSDGFYQYVGVRGVGLLADYTTRLLVQVDGHSLNNTVNIAEAHLGLDFLVPLAMVDRVEVVKGPVGSVYGPAAFLGVVNVVTRSPGAARGMVSASGEASQGRAIGGEGTATWDGRLGEVALAVGAEASGTRGQGWTWPELVAYPDRAPPPGGRVDGLDHGDAQKGYLRAAWRDNAILAGCGRWQRQIPSAPYSSNLLDPRNHEESLSCFAQVSHRRTLSPGLDLDLRLSADLFDYRDLWAYPEPADGGVGPFRDRGSDRWLGGDARIGWRSGGAMATAGITAEAHRTSQFSGSDLLPPVTVDPVNGAGSGPIRKDYLTVNAYALGEVALDGGLSLHGGLTWYRHQLFGSRITPRLAAVWQAGRHDTLKALYTEGFRAPAATEAFFDDVTDFIANPSLRPELARSGELVWERRAPGGFALSGSLFWTAYDRLIAIGLVPRPGLANPDPAKPGDFVLQASNEDAFQVRGADVSASVRLGDLLGARAAVSAQQVLGDRPAGFAPWTASLLASSRAPWKPLELALQAALLGPRRKLGAGEEGSLQPGQRPSVPATFRLDAAATLEVPGARGLSCQLAVRNLLDRDTLHPAPGDFAPISEMGEPPRTFRLSLRYRY